MHLFTTKEENIDFLKKYKLLPKTAMDIPTFPYYPSGSKTPIPCSVIGYDECYADWAVLIIDCDGRQINIHSSFLLEMKKRSPAPSKHSNDASYVIFDIETTGRNHNEDEIIELSAIKITGNDIAEFDTLVSIDGIIPINITSLTGISNEMIYDAPKMDVVLPQFLEFIGDCKLVGHNISSFDCYFINDACEKYNYSKLTNEIVDTLPLARNKLINLEHHRLSDLCEYYGIDSSNAHRALPDCYMCYEVYKRLLSNENLEAQTNPADNWVQSSNDTFLQQLIESLSQICVDKELISGTLRLLKNSNQKDDSYSVHAHEYAYPMGAYRDSSISLLNIKLNSKGQLLLEFREYIFQILGTPPSFVSYNIKENKQTGNKIITITFESKTKEVHDYICKIIMYRINTYRTTQSFFGCCDKFIECSDALKCVHENKLYSTACNYRHRLENGQIFYGKNRNID